MDGNFVTGSRGITDMPGQQPFEWIIGEVEPGRSAKIQMQLDRAVLSFEWSFQELSDRRVRVTQRIELTDENAEAYTQTRSALSTNLPDGMKKIATAMAHAAA
jgi:hypothetical protein